MIRHDQRAAALVSRMTWDEKIAQLHAIWLKTDEDGRLSIKELAGVRQGFSDRDPFEAMKNGIGCISRPLGTAPIDPREGVKSLNRIQRFLVERTRLGVPALPHEECLAGLMARGGTIFPSGVNMGALWDEDMVRDIAAAIGDEVFAAGSRQALSPVLDVVRDARWGRSEECFGEDPYLVGCLGCAYVEGLQGKDRRLIATLKHFAGHSFGEGGRNHAPVHTGERELNDVFLLPFEMAVRLAEAGSVMPAYHDIDGIPMHEAPRYLQDVLRGKWGFDGIVVSDYEGISQLHSEHRTRDSMEKAAAAAMNAGIDIELPGDTAFGRSLARAMDRGLVDGAVIDQAVRRILKEKSRLGLLDRPFVEENSVELRSEANLRLALRAAERSMVLLKNDGILPLVEKQRIALVGPLADDPLAMLNGYSFPVHLISAGENDDGERPKTLKEEFSRRLPGGLIHAKGCDILKGRPDSAPVFPGELGLDGSAQESWVSTDASGIPEAARAASDADVIVAAVGDLSGLFLTGTVGEGSDTSSLALPGPQEALLNALLDTGRPVVTVLSSGRPYNLGRAEEESSAILYAGLPGGSGAEAVVRTLFGDANPGGKLPVSMPRSAGALPYFYNHAFKSPGTPIQPDFGAFRPFGFGLSYTEFRVFDTAVEAKEIPVDGTVEIRCRIENIGDRIGDETVQIYVRDCYADVVRPVMELKAFRRVTVKPGEIVETAFSIPTDMLSFTRRDGRRVVEPGEFEVMLGTSSRNIVHRSSIVLRGPERIIQGSWKMKSASETRKGPPNSEAANPP